jgi:hypothetical protein
MLPLGTWWRYGTKVPPVPKCTIGVPAGAVDLRHPESTIM